MQDGFWTGLARHGAAPALALPGGRTVSYADLARRAGAFADGLGPQRRLVAVEMARSDHAVVAYLGALVGGHAVALMPEDDPAALDRFARRFAPDVVVRRADGRWRRETADAAGAEPHPDLALVMVTSGSTGAGKAVRLSRRAVDANARSIADLLGLGPEEKAALVLPLHYSYGLSVLNSHLAVGGCVDLGFGSVLDPGFRARLEANGCTSLAGVPHTFELLERTDFRADPPPRLSTMTAAGGRLRPDLALAYRDALAPRGGRMVVMYGQTEATARIAHLPPERLAEAPDAVGIAVPGGTITLEDEAGGALTRPGAVGELVYRGPNVMMGYAEGRADLARGAELDALRTGDLATRGADGLVRIVGRKARFSKIGGVRVGHDAVEAALAATGLRAVVAGDDARLEVAFEGEAAAADRVRAAVVRIAAVPGTAVAVRAVERLPMGAAGKPDIAAVRALFAGARATAGGVAEDFRETFFPHPVRETDSFASLSGDSLRHVTLATALERRLGRIPAGWERMSVGDLARLERTAPPRLRAVPTDLVVRALAILLVVVGHQTLWPVPGGAAAMMTLVGFGLARFQAKALAEGESVRVLRPLASVLVPYFVIVAGYTVAWDTVPWASVFLVGNMGLADPVRHSMVPYLYWFVEAYAQILILVVAVFASGRIRALALADPFRLGLVLLAGALAVRAAGPWLMPIGDRQIFALPFVLPLVAFGWCAAVADTRARRVIVLAAALAVMPALAYAGGNWTGSWVKFGLQVPILAALMALPALRLPAPLAAALLTVARAGFMIYLTHRFVPELLMPGLEHRLSPGAFALLAIVGGVLFGIGVHAVERAVRARLAALHPVTATATAPLPASRAG